MSSEPPEKPSSEIDRPESPEKPSSKSDRSDFAEEEQLARSFVAKAIRWMPLGGSGVVFLSFVLRQDWLMAVLVFPVTGVTVFWAAYSKSFLTRLQAIAEEEGTRHADSLKKNVDRFVEALKWSLAGTDKNYLRCQGYQCQDYEVEGLSLGYIPQLEEIFVPLELSKVLSLGSTRSSMPIPAGMKWDERLEARLKNLDDSSIWDLLTAAEKNPSYRRILIKAWGGYGKTTLLRHLTYCFSANKVKRGVKSRLPVLLRLRKWQETLVTDPAPDLAKLIEEHYIPHLPDGNNLKLPPAWAKQHLRDGNMLILWDGFDEVKQERRQRISHWMGQQMQSYPRTIFILTTRPAAFADYDSEYSFTTTVFIKPFNRDQIDRFVRCWYLCQEKHARSGRNTPDVRQKAATNAQNLINQIDPDSRPELTDLAKIPLLLNMIAMLHRIYVGEKLPQRRTELYQEILALQLGDRPLFRKIEMPCSAEESRKVLRKLALYMVRELNESKIEWNILLAKLAEYLPDVDGKIDPAYFAQKIEEVSEILVKRDEEYEFAHLSFQGYLAALEIKDTGQEDLLLEHWWDDWWKETILLYTALLKDPIPFIRRLCGLGTWDAGELALKCLAETPREVNPALENELKKLTADARDLRYQKLEDSLKNRRWQEADEETYRLMIAAVGKEEGQLFDLKDIKNFPRDELRAIDRLWVNYSKTPEYPDGKFGFSVQKTLWLECGGTVDYATEYKLGGRVGWRDENWWKFDMVYDLDTSVQGHLPVRLWLVGGRFVLGLWGDLISRKDL